MMRDEEGELMKKKSWERLEEVERMGGGVYHTQAADSGAFGMFQSCIKGKVIKRFLPPILVFTEITHLGLLLSR